MKFNAQDYPGDYAMVVESDDEIREFAEVLHAQGLRWCSGLPYVPPRFGVTIYAFNKGTYWTFPVEVVRSEWPQYKLLYWKDFRDGDDPSITLNFEDIFEPKTQRSENQIHV